MGRLSTSALGLGAVLVACTHHVSPSTEPAPVEASTSNVAQAGTPRSREPGGTPIARQSSSTSSGAEQPAAEQPAAEQPAAVQGATNTCHGSKLTQLVAVESSTPPLAPSLLAELSQSQRETLGLLSRVCETAVARVGGNLEVGCACCPPFDACPPTRSGHPRSEVTPFGLTSRAAGAFSAPGERELSLGFNGCEPHAENRGGTALYRETASGLSLVHYASGVHPSECRTLGLRGGRDVQLCIFEDVHTGHAHIDVFIYDFAALADRCWTSLVSLNDSSAAGCSSELGWPVVVSRLESLTTPDLNRDGLADVRVVASHRSGPVTQRYLALCGEWERAVLRWEALAPKRRGNPPPYRFVEALPKAKRLVFEFTAGEAGYTPTPETESALVQLNSRENGVSP